MFLATKNIHKERLISKQLSFISFECLQLIVLTIDAKNIFKSYSSYKKHYYIA